MAFELPHALPYEKKRSWTAYFDAETLEFHVIGKHHATLRC